MSLDTTSYRLLPDELDHSDIINMRDEIDRLTAENERLREVLVLIREKTYHPFTSATDVRQICVDALNGKGVKVPSSIELDVGAKTRAALKCKDCQDDVGFICEHCARAKTLGLKEER